MSFAICFNFDRSKILLSGNGFRVLFNNFLVYWLLVITIHCLLAQLLLCLTCFFFNSLPNGKILDWSADDIISLNEKLKLVLGWVENITSIFSFSHNVFKSFVLQGL